MSEQSRERAEQAARRREVVRMLDLSTLGMVFPMALLLGYFGGRWVGSLVGAPAAGMWVGLGLGFVAGFYNLYKVIVLLQRREESSGSGSAGVDGPDHGGPPSAPPGAGD